MKYLPALQLTLLVIAGCGTNKVQSGGPLQTIEGSNVKPTVQATPMRTLWSSRLRAGEVISTAIVVGPKGDIYFGTEGPALYCFTSKGVLKWRYAVPHPIQAGLARSIMSSPAYVPKHHMVLFGGLDAALHAVDAEKGTPIWRTECDGPTGASAVVSDDGRILTGCGNKICCVEASNGKVLWSYAANWPLDSTPLLVDGSLYMAAGTHIVALGVRTGDVLWNKDVKVQFSGASIVQGSPGKLHVAATSGDVYCFDRLSGDELWRTNVGSRIESSPAKDQRGRIYVGNFEGELIALDAASGAVAWRHKGTGIKNATGAPSWVMGTPLIHNKSVYYGRMDGQFFRVSMEGETQENYRTRLPLHASPGMARDGTVYIGNDAIIALRSEKL